MPVRAPLEPMLAKLARELPPAGGVVFEPKWDGFRCLAFVDGGAVDLRSRNDRPLARYFPEVVASLAGLGDGTVLDGELVAHRDGRPDFPALSAGCTPRRRGSGASRSTPRPRSSPSTCWPGTGRTSGPGRSRSAGATYDDTKAFARRIAGRLARSSPDRVTDRMVKADRAGRVFIDWSQNEPGKSTVAPYSLRGLVLPTVALPVTWGEVEAVAAGEAPGRSLVFLLDDVPARLGMHGDLWAHDRHPGQALPRPD